MITAEEHVCASPMRFSSFFKMETSRIKLAMLVAHPPLTAFSLPDHNSSYRFCRKNPRLPLEFSLHARAFQSYVVGVFPVCYRENKLLQNSGGGHPNRDFRKVAIVPPREECWVRKC